VIALKEAADLKAYAPFHLSEKAQNLYVDQRKQLNVGA
jgi:hypothetical protein